MNMSEQEAFDLVLRNMRQQAWRRAVDDEGLPTVKSANAVSPIGHLADANGAYYPSMNAKAHTVEDLLRRYAYFQRRLCRVRVDLVRQMEALHDDLDADFEAGMREIARRFALNHPQP